MILLASPLQAAAKQNQCVLQQKRQGNVNYKPLYAKGFALVWENNRYLALLKDVDTGKILDVYILQDCNQHKELVKTIRHKKPIYAKQKVNSIITFTVVITYALDELHALNKLVAVANPQYFYHPLVQEGLKKGRIKTITKTENTKEQIFLLNPDIIFFDDYSLTAPEKEFLLSNKMTLVPFRSNFENTLLGSSEWIVVIGAFLHKQKQARRLFKQSYTEYNKLAKRLRLQVKTKPVVITGGSYQGKWFVSGKKGGYMSRLVHDAGGQYLWDKYNVKTKVLSWETVLVDSKQADIWLDPGFFRTIKEMVNNDKRYKLLPVFAKRRIYNNTKHMIFGEANPFWEQLLVKPQWFLGDLAWILHDDKMKHYKPKWYIQLK